MTTLSNGDSAAAPLDASQGEADAVRERYARRAQQDWRYNKLNPAELLPRQEVERVIARYLCGHGFQNPAALALTDVGSAGGGNLLAMQRLGFSAARLTGVELLQERHSQACQALHPSVRLLLGDATQADIEPGSQDIVHQSLVFSSLLDDDFQQKLADTMWRWLRPGGAILWYDFTFNNPQNKDVRGVTLARVRELFPAGIITTRRVTLAPPITRRVVRLHPGLYGLFNAVPWLRTHALMWIAKPL